MSVASPNTPDRSFYERIARELEEVANTVRHQPEMNHHTAERLEAIAKEIRADFDLDPAKRRDR